MSLSQSIIPGHTREIYDTLKARIRELIFHGYARSNALIGRSSRILSTTGMSGHPQNRMPADGEVSRIGAVRLVPGKENP
ncbi:hypothetical protein [uncultured Methanoregula sp.]|uniref:hypothetical protein n=1 Tax=uncultured Methanoregula sp. TaxID=1005933 RepID=UPI003749F04F